MPYDDTPRDYRIIVRVDSEQRILEYSCPEFAASMDGWVTTSEKLFGNIGYAHHQTVILTQNAVNEHGIPLCRLEVGTIVERIPEEIATDTAALPLPPPSEIDLLKEGLLQTQEALAGIYETVVLGG